MIKCEGFCSVDVLWGMTSGRRFFVSLSFLGQRKEEEGGMNEKSGMLFYSVCNKFLSHREFDGGIKIKNYILHSRSYVARPP